MLSEPWKRVKNPSPLPVFAGAADLRALDDNSLAEALRDHMLPASEDNAYKRRWQEFWRLLGFDVELADRSGAILRDFLDQADAALESGDLDDAQTKRANRFQERCRNSLDRIGRAEEDPLGWLGARAAMFNVRARAVIAALVDAIDEHREETTDPTPADEKLWAQLGELKLDPNDYV
ncbi:hypothetical protein [Nocardia sp. IFM 10818]